MTEKTQRARRYTAEFRADAVRLAETDSRSLHEVAEALGVNFFTLRNWRSKYRGVARQDEKDSDETAGEPLTAEEELKALRRKMKEQEREIAQLKMDREILKKAAAFFAKESGNRYRVDAGRDR